MIGETVVVGGSQVDNVLVEPGLSRDVEDITRPAGARVDFTLRFPCGAEAPPHGAKVCVRGVDLDVLNVPGHWHPSSVFGTWSNPWDMTVLAGRTLGDFTATVRVIAVAASLDALGDPVKSETVVYEGPAQARMSEGYETDGSAEMTDAREVWRFVVPWQEGFAALRPQSTLVERGDARYDVQSVTDVDGKSEFACFEAVRHG